MIQRFICVVRFKREEFSEWEDGISVGPDPDETAVIIDKENKPVPVPVWNWARNSPMYHRGCVTLQLSEE